MKKIKGVKLLIFFTCLLLSISYTSFSQTEQEVKRSMAQEFLSSNEYDKSISLYEELMNKEFLKEDYETLKELYYKVDKIDKAEKLIKKAIKLFPKNSIFNADLGYNYLKLGKKEKAEEEFNRAINKLEASQNDIVLLANYFSLRGNYKHSVNTYQKARELFNDKFRFIYEISFLYQREGKYDEMTKEYISLLDQNPQMLNQVKIYLGNLLSQDTDNKLKDNIRIAILKKTQAEPNNEIIAQLYLWILLQDKEYTMALNQAKSIDRRFENQTGQTLYEVSNISLNNQDYKVAKEGFNILINKGKENTYYIISKMRLLSCLYYPFINSINHTSKEVISIKKEYETTLNELGKSPVTIALMQEYAYLLAYFLNSPQEAVDLLDEMISMNKISRQDKAKSKMLRADIYLMEGDIWEASLTYSQVEKEFKNDMLGSEAKFKNAMLSYYNGDFEWANSQFDALRSSTTKLIANDAMQYSLLISDNIDEDSSYNGLSYYSKADFATYQHKYEKALSYLDTLKQSYLSHPLFDEMLYKRAEIAILMKEYNKAEALLQEIIIKYHDDLMADDALFLLAELYETHLNNPQKAKESYQRIILEYSNSLYITEARKRYK